MVGRREASDRGGGDCTMEPLFDGKPPWLLSVHSVGQLLCWYYTTQHNSPARRNRLVFVMEEEASPTLLSRVTQVCSKYLEFTLLTTNRRWKYYTRKHGYMFFRPSWLMIISFSPSVGGRQPFSLWYNRSVLSISQTKFEKSHVQLSQVVPTKQVLAAFKFSDIMESAT